MNRLFPLFAFALSVAFASTALAQDVAAAYAEEREETSAQGENEMRDRVLVESAVGAGTLLVPALLGAAIGSIDFSGTSIYSPGPRQSAATGLGATIAGAWVGAALAPIAIDWSASLMNGRGNTGAAYLGFLAGAGAYGGVMALAFATNDPELPAWTALFGTVLPVIGSVIGYEISDGEARASFQLRPSVSINSDSFMLSASGDF